MRTRTHRTAPASEAPGDPATRNALRALPTSRDQHVLLALAARRALVALPDRLGLRTRAALVARAAVLLLALVTASNASRAVAAENIDPAGDGHQFAWGENVNWINAEPSGNGGPGVEVADFALTGWMWGENIGWISLSCVNTASCMTSGYGVVNDGYGVLSGFAWNENTRWINFRPTACAPDPTCGVRIDASTGYFFGRAWGENVGWVTFASGPPIESTVRTSWCQGNAGPPGPTLQLRGRRLGQNVSLTWNAPAGASWYDVVAGSLSVLRASRGNFAAATETCLAGKLGATTFSTPVGATPPGTGSWFLVRGANCRGRGTFDTGVPSQIGSRDDEIAASGHSCP